MRPASQSDVVDGRGTSERRFHEVVEFELPRAPAAPPVRADEGAAAHVPLPDLALDVCGNRLTPRGAVGRRALRSSRFLRGLSSRLDGAPSLPVLLDRAAHRLAQHRADVAAGDLVREERLHLLELVLEGDVHSDRERVGVFGHGPQPRSVDGRSRNCHGFARRIRRHAGLDGWRRESQRRSRRRSGAVRDLPQPFLRDRARLDRDDEALHLRLRLPCGAREQVGRAVVREEGLQEPYGRETEAALAEHLADYREPAQRAWRRCAGRPGPRGGEALPGSTAAPVPTTGRTTSWHHGDSALLVGRSCRDVSNARDASRATPAARRPPPTGCRARTGSLPSLPSSASPAQCRLHDGNGGVSLLVKTARSRSAGRRASRRAGRPGSR